MVKLGTQTEAAPEDRAVTVTRKRFLRRQRARRWKVLRRVLIAVALIGAVLGALWLVFFSSTLAVQGTKIQGLQVLDQQTVETAAAVPLNVPLATVDLGAIKARVEDLAAVESAEVSRSWPDRVQIDVTEREAVAVVVREGVWRGLDPAGVLFRDYPEQPAGLPEVRMNAATPVEALAEAGAVIRALPVEVLGRVAYLDVGTIDSISLHFGNGATVNWGSADESENKAEVLTLLLKQEARVYDVTAPGRPTVRP